MADSAHLRSVSAPRGTAFGSFRFQAHEIVQYAIQTSGLTKRFGARTAIDHLSFEVGSGEMFGLVGPDGAGKTTTLRILAGILTPDEGSATVAGCDVIRDPEGVKRNISYMAQHFGLYEDLTVEENIRFYADLFEVSRRQREARSETLLSAYGLASFRRRLAGELSGGMKQKLSLTCALIHSPSVILLDEPTTGVDPISRREFWRILYSLLAQGVTVLTSTAYLDEAERCTRLALLHNGRLLLCDTPARLKESLRGSAVAIVSSGPRAVRDALSRAEGIQAVVLVGDGIHLMVDDPSRRIPQLRQQLTAANVPFDELAPVSPTIEDLFVASLQKQV